MIGIKFLVVAVIAIVSWMALKPIRFNYRMTPDGAGGMKKSDKLDPTVKGNRIVAVLLFIVIAIIVVQGFGTIKQGYEGVVVKLDRATGDVKGPGLYWVTPIVYKVVSIDTRLDERERTIEAATSDQQDVAMKVTINYRVDPAQVVFLYSEYQRNYDSIIDKAIDQWAKDSSGHYTPQEMLTNRSALASEIKAALNNRDPEGAPQLAPFTVVTVNIDNLTFSAAYTQSIEDKQVAEQDALKEENVLRQVELQAQQELARAKVEAEKIRIQAEAITAQGGSEYVMLQLIQQWDGSFPANLVMGGDGGPFQILDVGNMGK